MPTYNTILSYTKAEVETEPVTLSEAKAFCAIDSSDHDTILAELITAARDMCEDFTCVNFVKRDVEVTLDNSNGNMYLPFGPVVDDIDSIVDEDGDDVTDYKIIGQDFKLIKSPCEILTLEYSGGYETLPKKLKTALLNQVYYLFENRSLGEDKLTETAKKILKPYRRV